jgi:drug/metabolite transporter (DMT)-like permease
VLLVAVGLSGVAAFMHAGWNVLLKTSGDPLRASVGALAWATVALTPIAAVEWAVDGHRGLTPTAVGLAALSCVAELAYFWFLSQAYRRGELSTAYPIARGLAPVLALSGGLLLLGERLSPPQALGVAAVLGGILLVAAAAMRSGSPSALGPAFLTGLFIAIYTVIDRVGVRVAPVALYGWVIFAGTWLLVGGLARVAPGLTVETAGAGGTSSLTRSAATGLLMGVTYVLVLFALSIAPVSIVAPLRESSIVLVAVWGVWRLRERGAVWWRIAGAGLTVAGAGLLAAGS